MDSKRTLLPSRTSLPCSILGIITDNNNMQQKFYHVYNMKDSRTLVAIIIIVLVASTEVYGRIWTGITAAVAR